MPLRFVNPNYHVILIHYPLGVFVLGVVLELFSVFWRRSSVRVAARWMILFGALLTLPALTSGIYALHDIRRNQGLNDARIHMLRWHIWLQSIASLLAIACAVTGLGASDRWRQKLHLPLLAGVVIAWGLMVAGSWHGGETIYQQGTSVAIIKVTTAEDEDGKVTEKIVLQKLKEPKNTDPRTYSGAVKYYMGGELQMHLIFSGMALAVAFGALGLSIRRLTTSGVIDDLDPDSDFGPGPVPPQPRRVTDDMSVSRSMNPDLELELPGNRIPVARFWLLAALGLIVTAVLGYWVMSGKNFATPNGWKNDFLESLHGGPGNWRHLAHLILGSSLVVVCLVLAIFATWAPRRGVELTLFSSLLVLLIAAQIWMGVLLTFDDEGPLLHFNREDNPTLPAHGGATSHEQSQT